MRHDDQPTALPTGHDELEDHDKGLSHDLPTLVSRRRALGILGGLGLAATVAGCSGDDATTTGSSGGSSASAAAPPDGGPPAGGPV